MNTANTFETRKTNHWAAYTRNAAAIGLLILILSVGEYGYSKSASRDCAVMVAPPGGGVLVPRACINWAPRISGGAGNFLDLPFACGLDPVTGKFCGHIAGPSFE